MKYIFSYVALFLVSISIIHAQEEVLRFPTKYVDAPGVMESSFTMVNDQTGDFTTFLVKKSDIAAFHFSSDFENQNRIFSNQLPNKYKIPLGGTVSKKNYTLFYSNDVNSKFAGIHFDFESVNSNVFEIDLNLKKEVYLTTFTHNNTFYLLSASYRESLLFLYTFDNWGGFSKKTIDLTSYEVYGAANYPTRLKSTLALDVNNTSFRQIVCVKENVPYSLDSLTPILKLYLVGDSFYLVSDINTSFTQIISHDLKKHSTGFEIINHANNLENHNTNSFLLDNKLFQIKVGIKDLSFQITDISNKEVLKTHFIEKGDSIHLTQGPIQQRGGRYTKKRELDKTSQFLRKLSNGNPCLYGEKIGDDYYLNIGSVDDIEDGLLMAVAYLNPLSVVASIGIFTLYVNPVALSFYKVSNSKAVYINTHLDENFNIASSDGRENIFYLIQDYLENEEIKRYTAADIFIYKDYFMFGMIDKKSKSNDYIFLKFRKP